jgi:uncharacterized protein DUF732
MSSNRFNSIVTAALATGALSLAFFTGAGAANAGSMDDEFLTNISAEGIAFDSERGAVQEGNLVCSYLAGGETGVDITSEIMSNSDLTAHQAAVFVVEAASAYCPGYLGELAA